MSSIWSVKRDGGFTKKLPGRNLKMEVVVNLVKSDAQN